MFDYPSTVSWLFDVFAIQSESRGEFKFPCPKCEHPNFYFNANKKIGFCHRASCNWSPTLSDLIDRVGYGPDPYPPHYNIAHYQEEVVPSIKVTLPEGAAPIVETNDVYSLEALKHRGLNINDVLKFNIHSARNSIIIPVYEDEALVQYVKRLINRDSLPDLAFKVPHSRRYLYSPGAPISNFFLGWEECKAYTHLVLVENSFNAMWLRHIRNEIPTITTSNFGSNLSNTQVDKIVKSNIKYVTFLWDAGAEIGVERATRKLKSVGIYTSSITPYNGQPDDHSRKWCEEVINESLDIMLKESK